MRGFVKLIKDKGIRKILHIFTDGPQRPRDDLSSATRQAGELSTHPGCHKQSQLCLAVVRESTSEMIRLQQQRESSQEVTVETLSATEIAKIDSRRSERPKPRI